MKTVMTFRAVLALLAVSLLAVLAGPSHAAFVGYDDFSSGDIDPEKWSGFALEGSFAAPTTELLRFVDTGALRLALVSWGDNSSDAGSVRSRQGLNMRQLGTPGGPGFITGLSAKLTVLDADAQDCTGNPETTRPSRSRAQIIGGFFNDGSGGVGDRTGDILAFLQLQKERDGQNRIVAGVNRCVDATCSSSVAIAVSGTPAVFTTAWSLDTPLLLELVWNQILGKFVFTVTNPSTLATESKEIVYAPTVTDAGAPIVDFKSLRVENDAENCTTGRKLAAMDATFDDVKVTRITPADFNGDGKADILWRHTSGSIALWFIDGVSIAGSGVVGAVGTDWTIVGAGDFNADGKADILWRHTSGTVAVWLLNGTTVIGSGVLGSVSSAWTIAGVGDFNGDGKADILWRHTSGTLAVWLLNGSTVTGSGVLGGVGTDWTVARVRDFNGDGKADILWRHTSGTIAIWLLDGSTVITSGVLGGVSTDWQVQ
jgi:hypothetical protein